MYPRLPFAIQPASNHVSAPLATVSPTSPPAMANPHDPSTQSAAARFAHSLRDSGASSLASPEFASYMDTLDPLASIRGGFSFPTKAVVWPEKHRLEMESRGSKEGDETAVYMAGNSLGLMPNAVTGLITEELEAWKSR